jgi:hypothetical protein
MHWKAFDPQKQIAICAIPLMLVLTACSVGMATSGQEDPELSAVRSGAKIHEVERELGRPISTKTLENGDTENLYRYELGNEPSAGRAVMHGTMDVLTLGLWELVGTPVEGSMGTEYEMTVTYGPDGEVKQFSAREIDPDAEIPLATSQESRPESTEGGNSVSTPKGTPSATTSSPLKSREEVELYLQTREEEIAKQIFAYLDKNDMIRTAGSHPSKAAGTARLEETSIVRLSGEDVVINARYRIPQSFQNAYNEQEFLLRWVSNDLILLGRPEGQISAQGSKSIHDLDGTWKAQSGNLTASIEWWKYYVVPSNRQFSNHLRDYTERHKLMLTDNIVANKAVIQSVEFVYTSEDIAIVKIAYAYGNIRYTQNTAYDTILFELRKLEFNQGAQIISHGERASEQLHTLQAAK